MAETIFPYNAGNKEEYEEAMERANVLHLEVNTAYIAYHKVAMEMQELWDTLGREMPPRGSSEQKQYAAMRRKKSAAHNAWQKIALRHGAMFVPPSKQVKPKEETVW